MVHSSFWNVEWMKKKIFILYQIKLRKSKAVQHLFSLAPIRLETGQK